MRATDLVGTQVHAARLLLQDVHPPPPAVAALREGAAPRRRPRRAAHASSPSASGAPSTGAGTPTCSWSVAAWPASAPRRPPREAGADVVLVDEGAAVEPVAGVETLSRATALGYFDGMVPVWQGDTLHQIRARAHVFATGAIEQPLVFAGNDLPGVMLSGGARAPRSSATRSLPGPARPSWPPRRPGTRGRGQAARRRRRDRRRGRPAHRPERAAQALAVAGHQRAAGPHDRRGQGGQASQPGACSPRSGRRRGGSSFECDLVVVSGGFAPATSLLSQAGARTAYDPSTRPLRARRDAAQTCSPPARWPVTRIPTRRRARASGPGAAAAGRAGRRRDEPGVAGPRPRRGAIPPPVAGDRPGQVLRMPVRGRHRQGHQAERRRGLRLDRAVQALHDGDDGPLPGADVPARLDPADGARRPARTSPQVGTTTARPPWTSVPMGVLAGRPIEPAKRSAIHGRHRELNAQHQVGGRLAAALTTTATRRRRRWPSTRPPD